ncbi:MAG: hypothetical protein AAGH38_10850, partial [Pseudomonadota bacterium]
PRAGAPIWLDAFQRSDRRSKSMNFETYTDRARGFIQAAQTIAIRDGPYRFQNSWTSTSGLTFEKHQAK